MYCCYKHTGERLSATFQVKTLIFSSLWCRMEGLRVPALDLFLKLEGPIEFRNVRSQRCENRIRSQVLVKADFLGQGRFDQEGSVFGRRQARMPAHLRSQRNLRVEAYFVIAKGRLDVGRDSSGLRSKMQAVPVVRHQET